MLRLHGLAPLLVAPLALAPAPAGAPQAAVGEKERVHEHPPRSAEVRAHFEVTPKVGDAPLNVRFWDRSVGPVSSWHWDFGDGSTSDERNACHQYAEGGVYAVSLTVRGPGGDSTAVKPMGVAIRDCPTDSARDNRASPLETGYDYVPVTGDDSLGFYCVYSGKALSPTDSTLENNVGIFVFPLSDGGVLIFGSGYGDSNSFVNATRDADYDVRRVDSIIRFCLRRKPRETPIQFVAPHGHVDHVNSHFIRELRERGYPIGQIAFHEADAGWVWALQGWTAADRALFRPLRNRTGECQEELASFDSPLGRIWFFSRAGHTPGSIDLALDIEDNPNNRLVVRGSGAGFGSCPISNVREFVDPHGNVRLAAPRPHLISVSPATGSSRGGTELVLNGTNFAARLTALPKITIDGVAAEDVRVLDDQTLTCVAPGGPPGATADIRILNRNGQDVLEGRFSFRQLPTLTGAVPSHGPASGGTVVTLQGTGFMRDGPGQNYVTFGGIPATGVQVVNDTTLQCVAPPGLVGPAALELWNLNGESRLDGVWRWDPVLEVHELVPRNGSSLGGARVQVVGQHFAVGTRVPSVHFSGVPATNVVRLSDTALECTVPPGPPATAVDIRVDGDNGQDILPGGFTYFARPTLSSVSPASGPARGGTPVTITGTGFMVNAAGVNTVEFGGVQATDVTVVSNTSISCTAPAGTAGQRVTVRVLNGNGIGTLQDGFRYNPAPVIQSIQPGKGPRAGGTEVTLLGTGFQEAGAGATEVWFGSNRALDVVVHDDFRVTCSTRPNSGDERVDVRLVNGNGESLVPDGFRFLTLPRLESLTPRDGPAHGGTLVTLTGSGFAAPGAGRHVVTFGGVPATSVQVLNNSTLTCRTPFARPDQVVDVRITSQNGEAVLADAFRYLETPHLFRVAPSNGPEVGGTLIEVFGRGFAGVRPTRVEVGARAATAVEVLGDGRLRCLTPPGPRGPADVLVHTGGGTTVLVDGFFYGSPGPELLTVTPAGGSSLGGETVELDGRGFRALQAGTNRVFFAGVPSPQVQAVSDERIVCVAPPGAPGSLADVRVANDNGDSLLAAAYRYHLRPTLASVSPSSGVPAGGAVVTLGGAGFTADGAAGHRVWFGTAEADLVTVVDDGSLTCRVPPGESGRRVDVRLATSNGDATLAEAFRYLQPPSLSRVVPDHGPAAGGEVVALRGLGFADPVAGPTDVAFGGSLATEVTIVDDTTITCRVPPGTPGSSVDVGIANNNGTDLLLSGYRHHAAPTLASCTPSSGPAAGGTTVLLSGSGFLDDVEQPSTVLFGALPAAAVTTLSDTTLEVVVPAGAPGQSIDLVVSNSNGESRLDFGFRYNDVPSVYSFSPPAGSAAGGTQVTIHGRGFLEDAPGTNRVFFGSGQSPAVTTLDDQTLRCTVPEGTPGSSVAVRIENDNGVALAPETFAYFPPPDVTAVVPAFGFSGGGALVEVQGSGFALAPGTPSVTFGGVPATGVVVLDDATLRCVTPAGSPGLVDLRVVADSGEGELLEAYYYDWAPTIASASPARGTSLGGTEVLIEGGGFDTVGAGKLRVRFGSNFATNVRVLDGFTLLCESPVGFPGTIVNVQVFNSRGSSGWNGFTYNPRPALAWIDPDQGLPSGGTEVTLSGSGFQEFDAGIPTVLFDDIPATNVTVVDDSTITCLSPAGPSRTLADVRVENANGATTFVDGFRWLRPEPGDLNSDGITDATLSGSESVFVFFGSDLGLSDETTSSADARFLPSVTGIDFGARVATGDLDGDGLTDLAIAAPLDDGAGQDAGAVFVFMGPLAPSPAPVTTASADAVFRGRAPGDLFGSALGIGDVTGDGEDDLVVGSPYDDEGAGDAGAVFVYAGVAGFSSATPEQAALRVLGLASGDAFGSAVAIGDLTGDGLGDLAVGAALEDGNGGSSGGAYVFRGGPTLESRLASQNLARIIGPSSGARFGTSATIADFDGDGIGDLFVGAPEARSGPNRPGAVYVYPGGAGLTSGLASAASGVYWGEGSFDRVGTTMALGDVDGDGRADLLASGALHDVPSANTGRAYLVLGGTFEEGILSDIADTIFLSEGFSADQFGMGLSILDLDADGLHEVLVGAPFNDGGGNNAGRVYLFSGPWQATREAVADDATITGVGASLGLGREAGSQH